MLAPADRRWLRAQPAAGEVAVVTYNLLARGWATPAAFPATDPANLAWDGDTGRASRLAAEIAAIVAAAGCPVVLAAQEVDDAVFRPGDALGEALRAVFDGGVHYNDVEEDEGAATSSTGAAAPRPAPALFWSAAAFDAVSPPFRLRLGRTPWAAALPRDASSRALARTRDGAVGIVLKHRATGSIHVFTSAHLFWDPRSADVKSLQAASLAAGLADAAARAGTASVIVGGDFNALPVETDANCPPGCPSAAGRASGVYELLTTGTLAPAHPHHPHRWRGGLAAPLDTAGLRFVSARAALGGEPPATTKTGEFEGVLDYVWVTQGSVTPVGGLEDPAKSVSGFEALPNAAFGSDHVAVGVVLRLAKGVE